MGIKHGSTEDLALMGSSAGSVIIVPLLFDERLTGLLGVLSHTHPFSLKALDILPRFADICAAALRP